MQRIKAVVEASTSPEWRPQTISATVSFLHQRWVCEQQDLTTFTVYTDFEIGEYTVTSSKITWDLNRDEVAYAYKLYGNITDFWHIFNFSLTGLEAGDADSRVIIFLWQLNTVVDPKSSGRLWIYAQQNADDDFTYKLVFAQKDGGSNLFVYTTSANLEVGEEYKIAVSREGSSITMKLYNATSGELIEETTQNGCDEAYDYVELAVSPGYTTDPGDWSKGYLEDFRICTLQEVQQNQPPNAPTLTSPMNGTRVSPGASLEFTWNFSDPDGGDSQSAYRLQVDDDLDFSSPLLDTGKTASSWESYSYTTPSTLGIYYWRVKTWDSGDAEGSWSQPATFTVDRLKVSEIVIDLADEKLYARLRYESDDLPIDGGEVCFRGLSASTNGTGWAVFDLSGGDFPWGSICYGSSDGGLVTVCSLNQSVPLAKAGPRLIGGNCTVSSASWIGGERLDIDFNVTLGTYQTLIKGPKPTYVLNATWLLSDDYSNGILSIDHDGSRSLEAYYVNWGGLRIEGLTHGWLESVSLVAEELTLVVNGSAGVGTLYVNCSGWGAPYEAVNFTSTLYDAENQMFTGTYQLSSPLTLILRFGVEEEPGGGAPGGGGGGGRGGGGAPPPMVTIDVAELWVEAKAGEEAEAVITVSWSGTTAITLQGVDFGGYDSWFKVETGETYTGYKAEIPIVVKPPRDVDEGSYSDTMTLSFTTADGSTLTGGGVYHVTVIGGGGKDEKGGGDLEIPEIPEELEPIIEPVKEIFESKIAQMIGLLIIITMALVIISKH